MFSCSALCCCVLLCVVVSLSKTNVGRDIIKTINNKLHINLKTCVHMTISAFKYIYIYNCMYMYRYKY